MVDFEDSYEKQVEDCKAFIEKYGVESLIGGWTPDSVSTAIMHYIKELEERANE